MFAIATPTKQTAEDTIITLSGRLSSSTLLEDRRAAVLGLKSFASAYPATVSSNALRGLIGCLNRDVQDVDTTQATLQTLLQLFNPNEDSPEASEEIALWLADEFTQIQDNITLLLDLVDSPDFYSRLYALKLLSAILSARTERTEECIFTAPLGISKLVAVLDDRREAVRNEGLSLLTYLTPNSAELQKRVAFEDAFDRIFNIINDEGSLLDGGRIVEDCLILLANLLRLNISNQSFFRETGCVPKVARLLSEAVGNEQNTEPEFTQWARVQKNRNIYALLEVLRLFLITGSISTQPSQVSFWQHGVLDQVLILAFSRTTEPQIKAEALTTCADLIRGNPSLQEGFAQLKVTSVLDEPPIQGAESIQQDGIPKVYVIDGLLDLALSVSLTLAFDSRLAACECIKAYFNNHAVIRKHFLRRAVDGYTQGVDETANILTTLLQPPDSQTAADPYRHWFAAVILFHLIFENPTAKCLAMSIAEGDPASGEEVVTCLQTMTGNLIIGIQKGLDRRVQIAYLMLLCGWLFEDPDGVNDFLCEGSHLQSLAQVIAAAKSDVSVVPGLCALLLGIVYEFSTKDSPIPRATISAIILSQVGREKYIDRLTKFRSNPVLRDFEVIPQKLNSALPGSLPEVLLDRTFVDFVKDNYSRLLRAIDRDPGFEIPVITDGIHKGISREMVDSLKSLLDERNKALQKSEEELASLSSKLDHEHAEHCKAQENLAFELSRIKNVKDALQKHHEKELTKLRADLQTTIDMLKLDLDKANENHFQELQKVHKDYLSQKEELVATLQILQSNSQNSEAQSVAAAEIFAKAEASLAEKEKEKQDIQGELDDLLMVFGDLEDKLTKYKKRLKSLGENISDGEYEGEDEDEDGRDE